MLSWIQGCANMPDAPSPDVCSWVSIIVPDEGFETRWTRQEKEQVLLHDMNVEMFCQR